MIYNDRDNIEVLSLLYPDEDTERELKDELWRHWHGEEPEPVAAVEPVRPVQPQQTYEPLTHCPDCMKSANKCICGML